MYNIGDLVVYGSSGVCKVVEIGRPSMTAQYTDKLYYTLAPMYGSETIYTPVDTSVFIRPVISREEAQDLISRMPSIRGDVYVDKNLTVLTTHYKESLQEYDCEDLVRLIKSVNMKNATAIRNGKKPGQIDQRYMKRAENLLYGELAVALGIEKNDVLGYISDCVDNAKLD